MCNCRMANKKKNNTTPRGGSHAVVPCDWLTLFPRRACHTHLRFTAPLPDEFKTPKKGRQSPRVKLVPIPKDKLAKSVETIQGLAPYLGGRAWASPRTYSVDLLLAARGGGTYVARRFFGVLLVISGVDADVGVPWGDKTAVKFATPDPQPELLAQGFLLPPPHHTFVPMRTKCPRSALEQHAFPSR